MNLAPRQLVVFGDSGVYGWGDSNGGGWCERIRSKWMTIPNMPILYQLGVRGDGLEKVAQRIDSEWECRGELRRNVPDGLLLSVGINDSARIGQPEGRPQLTAEAYRFALVQLLTSLKNKTKVMVLGITAVDELKMPFAECLWYSNSYIEVYEAQIEESCLELDIPFLPIFKDFTSDIDWRYKLNTDGLHLNSEGHYWMYKKITEWKVLLEWAGVEMLNLPTPM